jgi:urease accessory protein
MLATGAVAASFPPRSRHQRVDGRARVVFGAAGIRDLEQVAPARLMFPHARGGDFPLVVTVTTSGGLTGGDRLRLDIVVEPGACATIVPQSAEKLYRALPEDAPTRIETTLALGTGARCEWLAQEAILFDGSRLHRTLDIDMAADARVLAMEMLVLGRAAMGETYRAGDIHDGWRIRRGGALIWADALRHRGSLDRALPYGFGDAGALATLVYAGPEAEAQLELARGLVEPALGGATAFDGMLIVRMLAPDATLLRREVMRIAGVLRAAIFGLSPSMPAICHC